jgi:carbamoyl-phosphate synthase large subunit
LVLPEGDLETVMADRHIIPTPWPLSPSVKEVVLPFGSFPGSDTLLGPEMRSTGEVMSFGRNFPEAFAKAQIAAGNPLPTEGTVLVSLADADKREATALVSQLYDMGFEIVATRGTARVLAAMGIPATAVEKVGEGRPDVTDMIAQGNIDLVINTPSTGWLQDPQRVASSQETIGWGSATGRVPATAIERGLRLRLEEKRTVGYRIRSASLDHHIPYVTTLVAIRAAVAAIRALRTRQLGVQELFQIQHGHEES